MLQHQETLTIHTAGRGLHDVSREVEQAVRRSGVDRGLCCVLVRHTSASLVIQENADPSARHDLENFLERLAPEHDPQYTHTAEGPDDMPAHLRSAVTRTNETIPVENARLVLGTWQGLYLCEHRRRPHRRQLFVHILGEEAPAAS
jgi:secondary thiamine-phosphate synthase enzyme